MKRRPFLAPIVWLAALTLLFAGCDLWSNPIERQAAVLRDVAPMDEERFWELIRQANEGGLEGEERYEALVEVLTPLDRDELAAFKVRFADRVDALALAELYAAFEIVQNGPASESFMIYRAKIVASGKARFEEVKSDYESILRDASLYLIDMPAPGYLTVADDTWCRKTEDSKARLDVRVELEQSLAGPTLDLGDLEAVQKRFPRIWEYDQARQKRTQNRDFGG